MHERTHYGLENNFFSHCKQQEKAVNLKSNHDNNVGEGFIWGIASSAIEFRLKLFQYNFSGFFTPLFPANITLFVLTLRH
jgi:hypothetical protein